MSAPFAVMRGAILRSPALDPVPASAVRGFRFTVTGETGSTLMFTSTTAGGALADEILRGCDEADAMDAVRAWGMEPVTEVPA